MIIIDLTVLQVDLMHLLAIQIHDSSNGRYIHQFYDYSQNLQQPNLVLEFDRDMETIIEPWQIDQQQCFIQYRFR